ncbi:hybrid sensor histidine kinase/response regulator [Achromobacter sp. Root565]|uniref:hybrid sensor histidine kinase/response regulator n=1 Tax=Achromobacter sp. Root565 TaxID=1736564 RepID=UPI00138F8C3C|nr:hybrid sensor histidine kinase/response regulator [Achromobacter sp. Root565]
MKQSNVLARLRRYQHLLVMGGGAAITTVVLVAASLEIGASINAHVLSTREEVSIDVRRSMDFAARAVATLRNNVQNMELAWQSVAGTGGSSGDPFQNSDTLRVQPSSDDPPLLVLRDPKKSPAAPMSESSAYAGLAEKIAPTTAAIAARNAGELTVYFLSADRRYLILSLLPWGSVEWQRREALDGRALFDVVTSSMTSAISPPAGGWRDAATGLPRFLWMPPSTSPLTGKPSIRVITGLMDRKGISFGTLVYELPLATLTGTLPTTSFAGACMVLAPDGSLVAACDKRPDADMQQVARRALDQGVGSSSGSFIGGYTLFGWPLGPTGWTLIYAQSWRDILAEVRPQITLTVVTSAVIVFLTWVLLLMVRLGVLTPAVKQAQRVFESENLSRKLIETAPVGLGLIKLGEGRTLLQSPTMGDVADRVLADGRNLPSTLLDHYHDRAPQAPYDSSSTFNVIEDDIRFATRDGTSIDLLVRMARARYQDEDVLVVAITDVTDKKRMEQELRRARRAADAASAAKTAFVAAMSHEIRTPLNAILGNLELLASSSLDDVQRDRLTTVRTASDGLVAVIGDVLDFSKIEAGELQLEDLDFDVIELAASTLAMFAPAARLKGIELVGEFGVHLTQPMRGDPTRLSQVLNNLLSNAIKFTAAGHVTLSVAMDETTSDVVIEVADTGIGMTGQQLTNLFKAFGQADLSIHRRFGGTGLGLALCEGLVKAMNGVLRAHSEAGVGSRFTVRMPLGSDMRREELPCFDGQKLLLITAFQVGRDYLLRTLKTWNLQVHCYPHPAMVQQEQIEDAAALVLWGDRSAWHVDDETILTEEASWVIDCRGDGPAQPVRNGRIIRTSTFGLVGLGRTMLYILSGQKLPAVQPEGAPAMDRRLRVLVVEDNAVNCKLFVEQLKLLGCDPTPVQDAQGALQHMENGMFDVLLTDISMPGTDGFELSRRVRARWPVIPILAATANVTPQQKDEGKRAGMTCVVGKPLSLAGLATALSDCTGITTKREVGADSTPLGGASFPPEIMQEFLQLCRNSVDVLRRALDADDAHALLAELHSLAGASHVFRLQTLAQQCEALSIALKQASVGSCAADVQALCNELHDISSAGSTHSPTSTSPSSKTS